MPGTSSYPLVCEAAFEPLEGPVVEMEDGCLQVICGTVGTWVLRLRLQASRLEPGTRIVWQRYNIQLAGSFQTLDPLRRDYVTASCSGQAKLQLETKAERSITLTILEAPLLCGDEIVLRIGDRRWGSVGSEVFWSTTRGRFVLSLDDTRTVLPAAADIQIEAVHDTRPDCLRLLGPSTVTVDEPFHLSLAVFDRNRNVVEDFCGEFEFELPPAVRGLPPRLRFTGADGGCRVIEGVSLAAPGVWRIGARLSGGSLSCRSNPMVCTAAPAARVYWGDLHAHGWGDSTMLLMHDRTPKLEPAERHRQGREYGRFDYGAPGAMSMTADAAERRETWQAYLEAFAQHDQPHRYVPFMAMEMHPGADGDRTLVFREQAPVPIDMREPSTRIYQEYGDRDDALLEVHIGGAPPYYQSFRPDNEALVEVSSAFGNAEWLLQRCLQQGFRFAITGASDLHLGLMGAPRAVEPFRGRFGANMGMTVRDSGFGSGPVGAIRATTLTRDALWHSLRQGHTFATSGDRIVVDLDAGGAAMGDMAELPDRFPLQLTVHGQEPIERIDLIVGEWLADSIMPNSLDAEWKLTFDRHAMPPGRWFYVRIKQVNNEWAWSAPIWFADREIKGRRDRDWRSWNHSEPPVLSAEPAMQPHLEALETYLVREGDRERFGPIMPIGIVRESMGPAARFISTHLRRNYPVTMRWFFAFELPKLRIDWGYESFGPLDCWRDSPST